MQKHSAHHSPSLMASPHPQTRSPTMLYPPPPHPQTSTLTPLDKSNISGIYPTDMSSNSQSGSPNVEYTPASDKHSTPAGNTSLKSPLTDLFSTLDFRDEATFIHSDSDSELDQTIKTQPHTTPTATAELMSSSFLSRGGRQLSPGGEQQYSSPRKLNRLPSPGFVTQYKASTVPPRARSLSPQVACPVSPHTPARPSTPPVERRHELRAKQRENSPLHGVCMYVHSLGNMQNNCCHIYIYIYI